ncbi:hypothetical protein F4778DRAFT_795045, partial [Xylariomycetidae sp. FL2044]
LYHADHKDQCERVSYYQGLFDSATARLKEISRRDQLVPGNASPRMKIERDIKETAVAISLVRLVNELLDMESTESREKSLNFMMELFPVFRDRSFQIMLQLDQVQESYNVISWCQSAESLSEQRLGLGDLRLPLPDIKNASNVKHANIFEPVDHLLQPDAKAFDRIGRLIALTAIKIKLRIDLNTFVVVYKTLSLATPRLPPEVECMIAGHAVNPLFSSYIDVLKEADQAQTIEKLDEQIRKLIYEVNEILPNICSILLSESYSYADIKTKYPLLQQSIDRILISQREANHIWDAMHLGVETLRGALQSAYSSGVPVGLPLEGNMD